MKVAGQEGKSRSSGSRGKQSRCYGEIITYVHGSISWEGDLVHELPTHTFQTRETSTHQDNRPTGTRQGGEAEQEQSRRTHCVTDLWCAPAPTSTLELVLTGWGVPHAAVVRGASAGTSAQSVAHAPYPLVGGCLWLFGCIITASECRRHTPPSPFPFSVPRAARKRNRGTS